MKNIHSKSKNEAFSSACQQSRGFQPHKLNDHDVMVEKTKLDDAKQSRHPNSIQAAMFELDKELSD
jgi:hypothetical protein